MRIKFLDKDGDISVITVDSAYYYSDCEIMAFSYSSCGSMRLHFKQIPYSLYKQFCDELLEQGWADLQRAGHGEYVDNDNDLEETNPENQEQRGRL